VSLAGQARAPQEQLELLYIAQAFLRLATFTTQRRACSGADRLPPAILEEAGR
jgi:hypothetical protein